MGHCCLYLISFLFNFKGNPVKRMKKLQKQWQNLIDLKKFLNKKKLSKS